MSTTSTVTILVELDLPLGNDAAIATQMCILIATQGDGTPLDPTSFGEEDTIKMSIGLGQEHSEGVLLISDMETILAFSSSPSMLAASQCIAAATTWCNEPVQLSIWPPTNVQVRDYIAAASSCPLVLLASSTLTMDPSQT